MIGGYVVARLISLIKRRPAYVSVTMGVLWAALTIAVMVHVANVSVGMATEQQMNCSTKK